MGWAEALEVVACVSVLLSPKNVCKKQDYIIYESHVFIFSRERSTNFLLIFFSYFDDYCVCENIYMARRSPEFIFFWGKFVICSLLQSNLGQGWGENHTAI